jgi:hypothetical protein
MESRTLLERSPHNENDCGAAVQNQMGTEYIVNT